MSTSLAGLRQPDRRSCGASALVAARMLRDPAYAEQVRPTFATEVLTTHRRLTRPVSAAGRMQLPWPPALGTPPWALASAMAVTTGTAHRTRLALFHDRAAHLARIRAATAEGFAVPVYIGSRLVPRHVVLVVDPDLRTYDPASGRLVRVPESAFLNDRFALAGWTHHFFSVLPELRTRA